MGKRNWDVRTTDHADAGELAGVLAKAFHEEPLMRWLLPDDMTRSKRLEIMFSTLLGRLYLPLGSTYAAYSREKVSGCAVWCPPNAWRAPSWRIALMAPTMALALKERVLAGLSLLRAMEKNHPSGSHWYLAYLGVSPEAQGTGAGAALLMHGLERCDAEGSCAYLETSRHTNVLLYERFGFRVSQAFATPGGVSAWGMYREPQESLSSCAPMDPWK